MLRPMNPTHLTVSVPDDQLLRAIGEIENVELLVWDMTSAPPRDVIDIVVPPYFETAKTLSHLGGVNVRLVQGQMLGYDDVQANLAKGLVFANARSVHETSTSELALALILASQRGIPDFVRAAQRGRWEPAWHESLADRTVLLVGYGGVTKAIESRLLAFETTITRVARTARDEEHGPVHDFSSLEGLLPSADVVVVGVPLSESTTHLVDDRFLESMRDGSLLVNISRGRVADTNALVRHASSGRLRLALDVTDPEPLPDNHPLFSLPNVLISPHVGGRTNAAVPRMARLVKEQIARMLRSEEPLNVVLRT